MVKAIKKMPIIPPLSLWLSILLIKLLGNVISNKPRNDKEKTIKMAKKNMLMTQLVAISVANPGPANLATKTPIKV